MRSIRVRYSVFDDIEAPALLYAASQLCLLREVMSGCYVLSSFGVGGMPIHAFPGKGNHDVE